MYKKRPRGIHIVIGCVGVAIILVNWHMVRNSRNSAAPAPMALPAPSKKIVLPAVPSDLPPPVAAAPTIRLPAEEYAGPLAELTLTENETALLFEAEEVAIADCMNERGFEYHPMKYRSTEELMPWTQSRQPGDVEAARGSGYGLTERIATANLALHGESDNDVPRDLPPEQREAWIHSLQGALSRSDRLFSSQASVEVPGIGSIVWDTNSCMASARRTVYGDDTEYMHGHAAQSEMIYIIDNLVARDPIYTQAMSEWSGCMKRRGFKYDHPSTVQGELLERFETGELDLAGLQEIEKKVATADSHCYIETGLGDALSAAEQRAEAKLRSTRQDEITELAAYLRQSLERAKTIAGSGEP